MQQLAVSTRAGRLVVVLYAAGIAAGLSLVALGQSAVPLCALSVLPCLVFLAQRVGVTLGVISSFFAALVLLMVVQFATALIGLAMLPTIVVVFAVVGLGGVVALSLRPGDFRVSKASALWVWAAALFGAVAWGATLLLAGLVPGAARFSWALMGDAANNVLFSRDVVARGGLGLGPEANPVPFPSALIGFEMAPGRDSTPAGMLAEHDILALVTVWALAIAVLCVFVGAVIGLMVRAAGAGFAVTVVSAAAASTLPLSWYFSGYPFEYGFVNAQPAMVMVLGSLAAHFEVRRSPLVALVVQCLAATIALAVWSPLVLVPLALGGVTAWQHRRSLWRSRRTGIVALGGSVAALAGFAFGVTLPVVIAAPTSLLAPGGVFEFRHWVLPALAVAAVALAVFAFRRMAPGIAVAVASAALASVLGLGFLLFVNRNNDEPWSYYPLKFSWLMSAVLVVVLVGAAAALSVRLGRRQWIQWVSLAAVALVTLGYLEWSPRSGAPYTANSAIGHVIAGDVPGQGDRAGIEIFERATPEVGHVMWHSGDPLEPVVNFWVWQLWADSMQGDLDLRGAAYGLYDHDDIDDLCRLIGYMDAPVEVETELASLSADLERACPAEADRVTVVVR